MEDLFPALVVIAGAVISLISSIVKAAGKAKAPAGPDLRKVVVTQKAAPAAPTEQPYIPAQPAVHVHLAPDCLTHDAPGSTGMISDEGKDPCHEEQLTSRLDAAEPTQEAPGLQLDWNGESLVKAFIMQEVLTRPAQRRAVR